MNPQYHHLPPNGNDNGHWDLPYRPGVSEAYPQPSFQQYAPQYAPHPQSLPPPSPLPVSEQQARPSSTSPATPTPIRAIKTRNSRACDLCNSKSSKCDGNWKLPHISCSTCLSYGASCEYNRPVQKRGTKPGSKVTKDGRPIKRGKSGGIPKRSCGRGRSVRGSNSDDEETLVAVQSQTEDLLANILNAVQPMIRSALQGPEGGQVASEWKDNIIPSTLSLLETLRAAGSSDTNESLRGQIADLENMVTQNMYNVPGPSPEPLTTAGYSGDIDPTLVPEGMFPFADTSIDRRSTL